MTPTVNELIDIQEVFYINVSISFQWWILLIISVALWATWAIGEEKN